MAKKVNVDAVEAFNRQMKRLAIFIAVFLVALIFYGLYIDRRLDGFEDSLSHHPPTNLEAEETARFDLYHLTANPVEGQVVYVPAYSHVYHRANDPYLLTITLSVRNTSTDSPIVVKTVRYFDTKGREVKSYLDKPVRLPALGTTEVIVEREDSLGGSGANFLVEWYANTPVTEPIIEAIMIGTTSGQGISFARRGSVISEAVPHPAVEEELPAAKP